MNSNPPRDFLAEATTLALQLDPVSWEFDLSDREFDFSTRFTAFQQQQFGRDAALATGTMMRDSKVCSLYQPLLGIPTVSTQEAVCMESGVVPPRGASSNSGSDADWEPEEPILKQRSSTSEDSKLRVREKGKTAQQKWLQKYKERQEEKNRKMERLQQQLAVAQKQLAVARKEKVEVEAHADVLERALMKMSMEKAQVQTDETPIFIPSLGWTSFDPRGCVVLCVVFDPPKKLTAKQAATITLRDHAKLWIEYVIKARECLARATPSRGQDCPHLVKLKALLDERHGFLAWTAANNLTVIHRLTSCSLESDPPRPKTAGVNHKQYADLLAKLDLTPQQSRSMVESRNLYLLSIGFHSASLARMQSQVMALDPTPNESLRNSSYLKWADMSRAMQEAVEEIHLCHVRLHFDLYHGPEALSAYQAGLLLIECFPYLPDLIALVRELASSHKAPSSEELLMKGAMRYAEKQGAADISVSCEPYVPVIDKVGDLIQKVRLWEDCPAGDTIVSR